MLVLGNGSNLLVADAGFDGLVVHLGPGFDDAGDRRATDGPWPAGGAGPAGPGPRTAAAGLTGLEWAVGVPGLGRGGACA